MRYGRSLLGLGLALACSFGCESGTETVHIEDYDADHSLRGLRHERGFDFGWTNPRMQHVVRLSIPTVDPRTRERGQSVCTGVLVGPDLVLSAAHCLKDTEYLSAACRVTARPTTGTGAIELEAQQVQDSGAGGPAAPPPVMRPVRRVAIRELAADPGRSAFSPDVTGGGDPVCSIRTRDRRFDGVLFRLSEAVPERGFARVRTADAIPGQLLPVIHHPAGGPKSFGAVRAEMPQPAIAPGAHIATPTSLPMGLLNIQGGSSGAPHFDEEGYVLGLVSRPCEAGTGGCVIFSSIAALMTLPSFQSELSAAAETPGFGLGSFGTEPFGDLRLTRTSFNGAPELPRRLTPRQGGGAISVGYTTSAAGQHTFALAAFDVMGELDATFGDAGRAQHDIPTSTNEELFDVAAQIVGGEERYVAVGTLADPDSIAVARFTAGGALDATFGTGGLLRLAVGDGGASGAAIAVDPTDQSIVVVGHAAVAAADGRLHGTPVVFRFERDGAPSTRCGGSEGFLWRPEGKGLLDSETLEGLLETGLSATYDMVVTDAALDRRGGVLMVGYLHLSDFHGRSAWIGRLTAACTADQAFGLGGSGAHVFGTSGFFQGAASAWLSAVVEDAATGRIFAGGTLTVYDTFRGFFAGRMFVAAFLPDGTFDETGFGSTLTSARGGAVVLPDGWHHETFGIALHAPTGDEPRVVLAGSSYEEVRRIQVASFFLDGALAGQRRPENPPGIVDAWATDIASDSTGNLLMSVAQRSE